ncbi:hypothetical protein Tco_0856527 [Tanacetum coccineum]|uniref:Uncharacterized protein n=1 Tax=Tanacetum coccineum TaxID=301880 RepID=A0ABQ5B3R0_9ASTR
MGKHFDYWNSYLQQVDQSCLRNICYKAGLHIDALDIDYSYLQFYRSDVGTGHAVPNEAMSSENVGSGSVHNQETDIPEKDEKSSKNGQNRARNGKA